MISTILRRRTSAHVLTLAAPHIDARPATPRAALPFSSELPAPPPPMATVETELPDAPGEPGSLWRDSARRVRRVPKPRALCAPPPPAEAALRFLAWCRDHDFLGERPWAGALGIWQLYLWHCDEAGCHPLADNLLSPQLKALLEHREVNDYSSGHRRRSLRYTIREPEPELQADAIEPAVMAEPRVRRRKAA